MEMEIIIALLDKDYYSKNGCYPEEYNPKYAHRIFVFNSPEEFFNKLYTLTEGSWYWVLVNDDCICSGAFSSDDFEIFEEYFNMSFEEYVDFLLEDE